MDSAAGWGFGLFFLIVIAIIISFIPFIIANKRGHHYKWIILVLCLVPIGFTWIIAFIWAVWPQDKSLADPIAGNVTGLGNRNAGDTLGSARAGNQRGYAEEKATFKISPNTEEARNNQNLFRGEMTLDNDEYKIFLVKKYGIEKNEALGKIICEGKLFDNIEQALQHAAEIDGALSRPSSYANVTNLTEVQKALAADEDANKQSPMLSDEAKKFGITHNGVKYCYKTYQYDQLDDALRFARNDVQSISVTKQDESPSSNKKIIALVVGVVVIIGGYFALQKVNPQATTPTSQSTKPNKPINYASLNWSRLPFDQNSFIANSQITGDKAFGFQVITMNNFKEITSAQMWGLSEISEISINCQNATMQDLKVIWTENQMGAGKITFSEGPFNITSIRNQIDGTFHRELFKYICN